MLWNDKNFMRYYEKSIQFWSELNRFFITDDLTIDDIARGYYMPKANLSLTSQKLYDCISGKRFILNDIDFPDFSKAIERSIATPGLWCNTTLKNKSQEFSRDKPNILETYLRIMVNHQVFHMLWKYDLLDTIHLFIVMLVHMQLSECYMVSF